MVSAHILLRIIPQRRLEDGHVLLGRVLRASLDILPEPLQGHLKISTLGSYVQEDEEVEADEMWDLVRSSARLCGKTHCGRNWV